VKPAVIPSARHKDEEAFHYLINEPDFGPSRVQQSLSEHEPSFVTHVQAGSEQLNPANKVYCKQGFSSFFLFLDPSPSSASFLYRLPPCSSFFLLPLAFLLLSLPLLPHWQSRNATVVARDSTNPGTPTKLLCMCGLSSGCWCVESVVWMWMCGQIWCGCGCEQGLVKPASRRILMRTPRGQVCVRVCARLHVCVCICYGESYVSHSYTYLHRCGFF